MSLKQGPVVCEENDGRIQREETQMEQETMCDDEYIRSSRSDDGEDDDDGDDYYRDKCVDERREDWRENGITSDSASIRTRSQERLNGTCDLSQNTQGKSRNFLRKVASSNIY